MRSRLFMVVALFATPAICMAQTQQGRALGVVAELSADKLAIKTDAGDVYGVLLTPATKLQQVAPGERDLSKAAAITVGDIRLGDRVLARGPLTGDKIIDAQSLIVMSQSAIAQRQQHDREEWQQRGVAGRVSRIDAANKEITIEVPALMQNQPVVVTLKDGATIKRYAPDSIRYADAKPSTVTEIRVGDQLRARGQKNEDGSRIVAEELVTGAFRSVAAKVVSVEGDKIQVEELGSKKPLTVTLTTDTVLKRFPEMGNGGMMVMRGGPGAGGPGGTRPRVGGPGGQGGPDGSPGPRTVRRGPDLQTMIERLPAITAAELKPGETVIVSTMAAAESVNVPAVRVLAGAETILEMRQRMAVRAGGGGAPGPAQGGPGGTWNLGDFNSLPIQ